MTALATLHSIATRPLATSLFYGVNTIPSSGTLAFSTIANAGPKQYVPSIAIPTTTASLTYNGVSYTMTNADANLSGSAYVFDKDATTSAVFSQFAVGGSYTGTATTAGVAGAYIQLGVSPAVTATGYTLTQSTANNFRSWQVFGSADASTWTPLDAQTNTSWTLGAAKQTYSIAAPASYAYYRLVITQVNAGTNTPQLCEFALIAAKFETDLDSSYPGAAVSVNSTSTTINGVAYTFATNGGNTTGAGWIFDKNTGTVTYFDGTAPYNATTGAYTGSISTNGINGAYFQIGIGSGALVTKYDLTVDAPRGIREWYVFGSGDGNTWSQLDYRSLSSWTYGTTPTRFTFTNPVAYTYYRFVISKSDGVTNPGIVDAVLYP